MDGLGKEEPVMWEKSGQSHSRTCLGVTEGNRLSSVFCVMIKGLNFGLKINVEIIKSSCEVT